MRSVKPYLNWKPRLKAHYMMWFDRPNTSHLDVGYDSSDPAVIERHLNDMQSAGVDVVTPDYYGSGNLFGVKVLGLLVMGCVKRGMTIAPCFDGGMVKHRPDMSISATAYMVGQMRAFKDKYSAVMEKLPDGRYLCDSFGWNSSDPRFDIDESKVCASLPEYAILFREKGGFSKTGSSGSFAWAFTDHAAWLLAAKSGKIGCGALCKGLDDHNRRPGADPTKSVWYPDQPARILAERDGQQWLDTIKIYNDSAYKPPYMQLVTWNDHEEGTELEYGIDSHVTCEIQYAPGGVVRFFVNGNKNTVGYTALRLDGAPILVTGTGFDLTTVSVADGDHSLCVLASGLPLFIDKTSPILTATSKTVPRVIWS
jgi:hypothetical protein